MSQTVIVERTGDEWFAVGPGRKVGPAHSLVDAIALARDEWPDCRVTIADSAKGEQPCP